ncbi:hypothetical protein [Pontixanthobacter sp. CEM42]|uniref:DUF6969 family protein n=1 Tax=Pontixanthobacter sp. CEM42 TaxID=2792077 RepID=UPI001AE0281A|nr:hypothetical protein [Pontixanthobacter sp. CEM42]
MTSDKAKSLFLQSTQAMFESGHPLMARVLGNDRGQAESWRHYPDPDVVNGPLAARWFYHCHPPEARGNGEHGHFHLLVGKSALADDAEPLMSAPPASEPQPDVVHIAALAVDMNGVPANWFTTNRWVTGEWLYPAKCILPLVEHLDFRGPSGDPLVNDWLTGIFALQTGAISDILSERDERISTQAIQSEDRSSGVLSSVSINLERLLG